MMRLGMALFFLLLECNIYGSSKLQKTQRKDHFFTQNRIQKWYFLLDCFKL